MKNETITKNEIDALYRKVNIKNDTVIPSNRLNLGTMHNRLKSNFRTGKVSSRIYNDKILK